MAVATEARERTQSSIKTRRCAVYIRVGTQMQVDRDSLSTQESQLNAYTDVHGWQVEKVFTDAGLSAKNTRRPALQQMLEWARDGNWNGGMVPFGYRWNEKTSRLQVVRKEAKTVRSIFEEYLHRKSVRGTVHAMNAARRWNRRGKPWALASLRRILSNQSYVGHTCYAKRGSRGGRLQEREQDDWIVAENTHKPIIDKKTFDKVQALLCCDTPRPEDTRWRTSTWTPGCPARTWTALSFSGSWRTWRSSVSTLSSSGSWTASRGACRTC